MKKKFLSVICLMLAALMLCSCGSTGTELFGSRGTSAYVKTGEYKKIVIDKKSDEYKKYYNALYLSDITAADLFEKVESGAVQNGDYANINFAGKVEGAYFDGGTSDNYDLLIGSGTFISGFEEGLIGVKVGETVDLNLKFPENYGNEQLNGKDVVFTVTVNYRRVAKDIEKAYSDLGYKSAKEYKEKLDDDCKRFFASKNFVDSCTFKETPTKKEFTGLVMMVFYDNYLRQSGKNDLKTYLKGTNQDINTFTSGVVEHMAEGQLDSLDELKSVKNTVLAFYALFEKEGLKVDEDKLGKTTSYERIFEEYMQISKACIDLLYKNASFK